MGDNIHRRPHSTPKVRRGQSSDGQGDHGRDASISLSLDETGESTRSLLSILSHSSVQGLPDDVLGNQSEDDGDRASRDSSSPSASPSTRSKSSSRSSHSRSRSRSPSSSRSRSQTDSYSKSSKYSLPKTSDTSTSDTTSSKVPSLSPWEKWLIEKTKEERKRLKEKAKIEQEKQLKIAEERKMKAEKAKVIKVKVNMWIEERTAKEQEARRATLRLEKTKKKLEAEEKRRIEEKAKENYAEWKSKKKVEKEMKDKKEKEERKAKEEADRKRKEEAEDAYLKWKIEARTRPPPLASNFGYPKGSLKGYGDKASYPIPSFYNPVPWMPIHTPQEHTKPTAKGQRRPGSKKGSSSSCGGRQVKQPLSPPLLFRDRSERTKHGRPR